MPDYDPLTVRADIPLLARRVHDRPLIYLDSAATSPTPRPVLAAMTDYYEFHHANVHRSVYVTAQEATAIYEGARARLARFLSAETDEIVFTKNATEALNLAVRSIGTALRPGDVILTTELEHHSVLVPLFQLRDALGLELRFIPLGDDFELDVSNVERLLDGAKLFAVSAMSNVVGSVPPLDALIPLAHDAGALVLVDAAQAAGRLPISVVDLDIDLLALSAHKMLGPTGLGALYAKEALLDSFPTFLGGGGTIDDVTMSGFTPAAPPARFEAGTPPISEAAGFTAALDYLDTLGITAIRDHEADLVADAYARLDDRFGDAVRVIGPTPGPHRGAVLSLDIPSVHPHDAAQVLDSFGVCARAGHHCAKPVHRRYGVSATLRVSYGPYSLTSDTDVLLAALAAAIDLFA